MIPGIPPWIHDVRWKSKFTTVPRGLCLLNFQNNFVSSKTTDQETLRKFVDLSSFCLKDLEFPFVKMKSLFLEYNTTHEEEVDLV